MSIDLYDDIYYIFLGSKEAGKALFEMLKLGSSLPWKEVIEVLTGEPGMRTEAFREYFRPLEKWLIKENRKNGVKVGWKVPDHDLHCERAGTNAMGANYIVILSGLFIAPIFF